MSGATDVRPFDVCGPLPSGVTVLEASAGTGKTYTIAGLAARYVAEGRKLSELLVVTFTRMATAELRDRVRERLISAERGLERALAGERPDRRDSVLRLLADGTRDEVELRRRRLAEALADFDAATITTTHGFCQEVLGGLGIAGDLEPGVTFVEDLSDLREEVVDDLYVRRFLAEEDVAFDLAQARQIVREAVGNPSATIEPASAAADGGAIGMRVRLACRAREELEERKRRRGVMTYDDLLTRLHDALVGPSGAEVAERLRSQYSVVLVDEFQDTDPVQWDIMRLAFGHGDGTLVLIGDPKQAIYAFRGADVFAYLDAAEAAEARATLDVNWRSDQGLIDAYDRMFGGAQLGHEGILYRPVRAAEVNQAPRLLGAPDPAPLRVRVVPRDVVGTTRSGGFASTDGAREHIAEDLAADVVALLDSGAQIEERDDQGAMVERVTVAPGHLAVLVRRNADAETVRDALDAAGVPAVLNGAGSVFGTEAAHDWLRLLEALERPSYPPRARAAALTAFLGWSAARVAGASEDDWEGVHRRLHGWAHVLRTKGVAALTERITLVERLPERVLARVDGERRLTDLRHVGQLLHAVAMEEHMAAAALTAWLRRRITEGETGDEEQSRRLESDAAAVQILTIHRSKGLEFPVVYLPYLWHPTWVTDKAAPLTFHDPDDGNRRKVDVALEGPDFRSHKERYVAEQRGEDLRLAYVGLTRAKHQAVVWWAGTSASRHSPLGRLVFARGEDGSVAENGPPTPSDAVATERFSALAAAAEGCVSVEPSRLRGQARWSPPGDPPAALGASSFDRDLDQRWRRTSYSDITSGAHEARVASEPEEGVVDDEPSLPAVLPPVPVEDDPLRAAPSLLAAMPAGTQVGTFVHEVFEATDFAAADLEAELVAQVARAQARRHVDVGALDDVVGGLAAAIGTPLGDGTRLRDVARADRLDELSFELPLVGGDEPTGRLTLAAIGGVLRRHLGPDDPVAGYASRLEDAELRQVVRGYLTGSIDLVLRAGGRYAIADYKTNWLGTPGEEELTLWHYRPAALAHEMQRSHYVLQALLYTVALHRYLRWRLPRYSPERHLGGVHYLFLRGMAGPGTTTGVFSWGPPAAMVAELSDVLDRGEPA